MANWLIVSLNVVAWGLSLLVLWRAKTVKSAEQHRKWAIGIIIAGLLIIGIGLCTFLRNPGSAINIVTLGSSVLVLSIAAIIEATGPGHTNAVRNTAWFLVGIGLAAFITGIIFHYIANIPL